jgi:hypothetical protein
MCKSFYRYDLHRHSRLIVMVENGRRRPGKNPPEIGGSQEKPEKTTYFITSATDRIFLIFPTLSP